MPAKPQIIADPQTNRGTAFTVEERKRFGLIGRLPAAVETLEQQATRAYKQVCRLDDNLDKYIYLEQLHDRNETLYYKVIIDHIAELLPIYLRSDHRRGHQEVVCRLPPLARRLPVRGSSRGCAAHV